MVGVVSEPPLTMAVIPLWGDIVDAPFGGMGREGGPTLVRFNLHHGAEHNECLSGSETKSLYLSARSSLG